MLHMIIIRREQMIPNLVLNENFDSKNDNKLILVTFGTSIIHLLLVESLREHIVNVLLLL